MHMVTTAVAQAQPVAQPVSNPSRFKRTIRVNAFGIHPHSHPRTRVNLAGIGNRSNGWPDQRPMGERLTGREVQVLNLLAQVKCAKEIAVELGMAVKTVETHKNRIYRKLETNSLLETVLTAIKLGLVECPCVQRDRTNFGYGGA